MGSAGSVEYISISSQLSGQLAQAHAQGKSFMVEDISISSQSSIPALVPQWLRGVDGATSIKAEIVGHLPELKDAPQFRDARKMLQEQLGGIHALCDELMFAGFVGEDFKLTVGETPFNIFARVAAGKTLQPSMEWEQNALGKYKDRFTICCNRDTNDMHWDSADPKWVNKASMARRHRLLTTKDLHWQWFNALAFGLVPPEQGGASIQEAVVEVEAMKSAALYYAKHVGGWSDQVGLYVNIFGHNNVNSLFIHVLDMSELGPSFEFLSHKNCALDVVLKVLHEEAEHVATSQPRPNLTAQLSSQSQQPRLQRRKSASGGVGGATSIKDELVELVPVVTDAAGYRELRRIYIENLGGPEMLFSELLRAGIADETSKELTCGTTPFNIFARCASGAMVQPGMEEEQEALGDFKARFMVCKNRPEFDEKWDSDDPAWVGKASMSSRHRFLTTKNLHWQWFNVLAFGTVPAEEGGVSLEAAVAEAETIRAAALRYAASVGGWSDNVGLFVHVFGHNSVNSLHIHIVDMDAIGPTFHKHAYKNCPLDAVLKVLREELDVSNRRAKNAANVLGSADLNSPNVRRSTRTTSVFLQEDDEILDLNVGGKSVAVPRSTLLQAPEESLLHTMFKGAWDTPALPKGDDGRIFVNFPPKSFQLIVNHLRLMNLIDPEDTLPPPTIPADLDMEFRILVRMLGVDGLIFQKPESVDNVEPADEVIHRRTWPPE